MKFATLLALMLFIAAPAGACPDHTKAGAPTHQVLQRPVAHRPARHVQRHPVVQQVRSAAVPCPHQSFIGRHAGWLWAGAGLVAGLVIENNVHDHAATIVVTQVVNACTGHRGKQKKDKCRK
jgi:hypothetical protein